MSQTLFEVESSRLNPRNSGPVPWLLDIAIVVDLAVNGTCSPARLDLRNTDWPILLRVLGRLELGQDPDRDRRHNSGVAVDDIGSMA